MATLVDALTQVAQIVGRPHEEFPSFKETLEHFGQWAVDALEVLRTIDEKALTDREFSYYSFIWNELVDALLICELTLRLIEAPESKPPGEVIEDALRGAAPAVREVLDFITPIRDVRELYFALGSNMFSKLAPHRFARRFTHWSIFLKCDLRGAPRVERQRLSGLLKSPRGHASCLRVLSSSSAKMIPPTPARLQNSNRRRSPILALRQ